MGPDALHGSFPALVTPLTADGQVDLVGTDVLVARAIADGARGVLVAGSTGEGTLLDPEQRSQLTVQARATVDRLVTDGGSGVGEPAGAAVVIAGASGATVADIDADIARLASAGADVVLVLPPSTYPLRPEELVAFHLGVAERAPVATMAYHIPQFTGSPLTPDAVRELAAHPRIVGMKDSSPDPERRAAFATTVRGQPAFDVVTGHAPTLLAALRAGVVGSITAIANVRQRQVVALHDAVVVDDRIAADRAQDHLVHTGDALETIGTSMPAALKAALQLEGLIAERWCRPPLGSVGPARLDLVRTALMR